MCLSAWGLPPSTLVRVFSGILASVLGWGAHLVRQVASGLCDWRRLCFLSTPGDCWPSGYVFTSSSPIYKVAQSLSSASPPRRWRISAGMEARGLLSSSLWLRDSSVGRSLFPSAWLHIFFRAPTISSLTLCIAPPAPTLSVVASLDRLSFRELRPVQHYFFASSPSRCCPISFSAVTDAHGQCQRAQTRFSILGAVSRLMWLSSHAVSSFTYLALVIFPGSQSAPASRLAPLQRFTRTA